MDVTDKLKALTLASAAALPGVDSGCDDCDDDDGSSSSDDGDVEASDALLGTLERGLNTVSSHARQYMNTCTTDENRKDMQDRLENSMIRLLRSEQVVKEIPIIVTNVVDNFVTEMEQEEDQKGKEDDENDDEKPLHCFKPMHKKNEESMDKMSQKLFKIFQEKVDDFEHSLTEDKLKKLSQFAALEKQVALSLDEFEAKINEKALAVGAGDATFSQDGENDGEFVKFYDPDDLSDDDSILPSIDPFSKKPMMNPVRNKYCNHVFEEKSVLQFLMTDPNPKCPLDYCRNERPFEKSHFVKVPKLTEQIRRKNLRDKDRQLFGS